MPGGAAVPRAGVRGPESWSPLVLTPPRGAVRGPGELLPVSSGESGSSHLRAVLPQVQEAVAHGAELCSPSSRVLVLPPRWRRAVRQALGSWRRRLRASRGAVASKRSALCLRFPDGQTSKAHVEPHRADRPTRP